MRSELIFDIMKNPYDFGKAIRLIKKEEDGTSWIAEPITYRKAVQGEFITPFLELPDCDVQRFMDCLWNAGVRPSNGEGSVGQIGAVERHLEDMRSIAFARLKVDKPQ